MSNNNNNNAMTSDSNNNNSSNKKQVDAKRKLAEMTLSRRFLDVLTHHLEIVADAQQQNNDNNKNKQNKSSSSSSSLSFQLEPAERKILYEINNLGIVEGLVAGALTLTLLRQGRSYFQRTLVQRAQQRQQQQQQQQQMFTSSPPPPPPSRSPFHQQQQQQHQQYQHPSFGQQGVQGFPLPPPPGFGPNASAASSRSMGRIPTMIGWLIDCLAAFTTIVAVSVAYTDVDEILQKVAELPLVEGHSVVARELCPPILDEIQKLQQQQQQQQQPTTISSSRPALAFDLSSSSSSDDSSSSSIDEDDMNNNNDLLSLSPRHLLQNPQTAQLGAIVKFAENCKRRQVMERSLRRENGISFGAGGNAGARARARARVPVEIPTPGVPKDLEVDLFSSLDNEQQEGGGDQDDDAAAAAAAASLDFYNPNNSGSDNNDDDNDAWSDDSDQRR